MQKVSVDRAQLIKDAPRALVVLDVPLRERIRVRGDSDLARLPVRLAGAQVHDGVPSAVLAVAPGLAAPNAPFPDAPSQDLS